MSDKKKILIVDDSRMIRKGLTEIFEASNDFEVVGEAVDGKEALAAIRKIQPDAVLILGDTNSCLAAIAAKRLKIPIFHMEAGNRCCDDRVPEEVNRRIIDHSSDILMPYTERSRANLLKEGIAADKIKITGNTVIDALLDVANRSLPIEGTFLERLPNNNKKVTMKFSLKGATPAINASIARATKQQKDELQSTEEGES